MKKVIIFLACLLMVSAATVWADKKELNAEQQALRAELTNFLKEEGFVPEIDSDGDIVFKVDGTRYFISVSAVDENPMYATLFRTFNYPKDYSHDVLLYATKALNRYKGVKVACYDESFRISAELYLRDAELMKSCFYKLKSQIDNVRNDIISECKKVGSVNTSSIDIPFFITKIDVANVEYDGTVIQDYGSTIYDYKSKYLQPRLTLKPTRSSGSINVFVRLYKDNVLQRNSTSSPENYTFSTTLTIKGDFLQTETLAGWGSKNAGTWSNGSYRFEVWYNDYCLGSTSFRIY